MKARLVCPDCSGRQVTWHGRTLHDCPTCEGKGSIPLATLVRDGILGFLLVVFALIGTIVAVGS